MAEHYSFFDAVLQDDGVTYDREYNAQQFTKYFGALVTTGVMKGMGNMLAVSANGTNMVTKIDTGIAFVEAKYYENDSFLELTHDTETLGKDRIDRIVVRMDLSTEARYVKAFIKKGVPSTNPVAPPLTQSPNLYEISLAQVKIVGGQTFIATNAITDERGTNVICPWAGSNILPSYDDNALVKHLDDFKLHTPYAIATWDSAKTSYIVNMDGITEYEDGMSLTIKIIGTNTSGSFIDINGLGPKIIRSQISESAVQANSMINGSIYTLRYNGTMFYLQGGGIRLNNSLISTSPYEAATAVAVKSINDKIENPLPIELAPIAPFAINGVKKPSVTKIGKLVIFSFDVRIISQLSANTLYQLTDSLPFGYRPKQYHAGVSQITTGNNPMVTIDSGGTVVIRPTVTTAAGTGAVTGCLVFETQ